MSLVNRNLAAIFSASTPVSRSMLLRGSLPLQDKLSYLIGYHDLTLVPHQNQILSRPRCGEGVGLSSLYAQSFAPWALPAGIGINSGDNSVLTCRQVATVVPALGKASYVLTID